MFRYSARPPETPDSIRWELERRRVLPDRFENGALEFVMALLSRLETLHHIRIGTEWPLSRPRGPWSDTLTTFVEPDGWPRLSLR
ncbi:hypothetical protein GCM10029976_074400 [Kribbella albertanoniae]